MASFAGIPNIPMEGLPQPLLLFLNSVKENVELLIGARGKEATSLRAIVGGQVTLKNLTEQTARRVSSTGVGVTINGIAVAQAEDHAKLMRDVQGIMNDVSALKQELQTLVNQLRG